MEIRHETKGISDLPKNLMQRLPTIWLIKRHFGNILVASIDLFQWHRISLCHLVILHKEIACILVIR